MDSSTDPPGITVRQGAYLPHWTHADASYAVCFRLADALPQSVLNAWRAEREDIRSLAEQQGRPLSTSEERRLKALETETMEAYLHTGSGRCHLRDPRVAATVIEALRRFDGLRYDLFAACVMPNHVHVVVKPFKTHPLATLLHSWKSYTATVSNRLLERRGAFWQPEYYDHLIRSEEEWGHAVRYVIENPVKAGLKEWPWVYVAKGIES